MLFRSPRNAQLTRVALALRGPSRLRANNPPWTSPRQSWHGPCPTPWARPLVQFRALASWTPPALWRFRAVPCSLRSVERFPPHAPGLAATAVAPIRPILPIRPIPPRAPRNCGGCGPSGRVCVKIPRADPPHTRAEKPVFGRLRPSSSVSVRVRPDHPHAHWEKLSVPFVLFPVA